MDCSEARKLIRAGAIPGAGRHRVPRLGFHLSSCPACRAFRATDGVNHTTPASAHHKPVLRRRNRFMARAARVMTIYLLCVWLGGGWYFGAPLVRAWRDVTTMSSLEAGRSGMPHIPVWSNASELPPGAARSRRTVIPKGLLPAGARAESPTPERTAVAALEAETASTHGPSATPTPAPTRSPTATPSRTELPVQTSAVTILVLGLDARPGEGFRARSDAIMLARLDPVRRRAALLSLPRDLWVPIPGFGEGKLDSAYILGEQYGESGDGAAVAARAIEQALGITIDHMVVLNFKGFRGLIDALGGVPVEVPHELYDAQFPTEDYGRAVAHFLPGEQIMDGERALMFSRIRHPDSDFERMRRQQLVVLGIARRLRERGVLRNLREADRLTAALRPFVRTDLPRPLALHLLWSMRSVDIQVVERITVDASLLSETSIDGAYALISDPGVLRSIGAQFQSIRDNP